MALPPGALSSGRSVDPPRYMLDVGSDWVTANTVDCFGQVVVSDVSVPSRLQAQGAVGGNGTRIAGQAEVDGIRRSWSLDSEP
ncbi:MAG: hypothetical protein KF683_09100 [Rubrivivax sp.]|nr:hypothetical protein [Rubrivivax sp.]